LIISEDDLARNRTSHVGTCVPLILIKAGPARPTTSLGEDQQRPDAGLLGITDHLFGKYDQIMRNSETKRFGNPAVDY
jgi:hypothetical protein